MRLIFYAMFVSVYNYINDENSIPVGRKYTPPTVRGIHLVQLGCPVIFAHEPRSTSSYQNSRFVPISVHRKLLNLLKLIALVIIVIVIPPLRILYLASYLLRVQLPPINRCGAIPSDSLTGSPFSALLRCFACTVHFSY